MDTTKTHDERFTGSVFLLLGRGNGALGAANVYWQLVSTVDIGLVLNTLDDGTASDENEAESAATSRLRFHDFSVGDWRNMTDDDAEFIDSRLASTPRVGLVAYAHSLQLAVDAHRRGQVVRFASLV